MGGIGDARCLQRMIAGEKRETVAMSTVERGDLKFAAFTRKVNSR